MLGHTLITAQTGPAGKQVNRLYIEDGCDIEKEFYLSMLVDRETSRVAFVVSTEGGMDIEKVAHDTPDKIVTFSIDPATGVMAHHGRAVARALGLIGNLAKQAESLTAQLYSAFVGTDMAMLEINPLVVTKQGELRCLDAKVSFDSNALYRHSEVVKLRDLTEEDGKEIEASKYDLNYIALEGTIGCMVNGAGLAMATMDIIKLYGATPANFLDVGGGATKEKVAAAFKIITSDPNVKGILVNIFGGIMRCDVVAEGVVAAVREVGLTVPLVVRLEGTNVELGKRSSRAQVSMLCRQTTSTMPHKRLSEPHGRRPRNGHSDRQQYQGHMPGLYGQKRHLSFRAGSALRDQNGRRHVARQGQHQASRFAGVRYGGGSSRTNRCRCQRDLCPATGRGRRDL